MKKPTIELAPMKSSLIRVIVLYVVCGMSTDVHRSNAAESPGKDVASSKYTSGSGIMLKGCFALGPLQQPTPIPYELSDADKRATDYAGGILVEKMLKLDESTWRYLDTGFNDWPKDVNNLFCELVRIELGQADRLNGVDWTGLVAFGVEAVRSYDRASRTWSGWVTLNERFAVAHVQKIRGSWTCTWGELHYVTPNRLKKPPGGHTPREQVSNNASSKGTIENMAAISKVCPSGTIGEFRHGTKCTGYYDEMGLVDIQPSAKATKQPHVMSKSLVHAGVDIIAIQDSEVFAFADGTVDDVVSSDKDADFSSLGYMVIVEHKHKSRGKLTYSAYLHLREKPPIGIGEPVIAGKTVVGKVGSTGAAFGPHLHLEVRHFAGRFSEKWKNIYGIERPKSDATFDEKDFQESWSDPILFLGETQAVAPPLSRTQAEPRSFWERKRVAEKNLDDSYKKLRERADAAGKKRLAQELLELIRARKQFPETSLEGVLLTEQKAKEMQARLDTQPR